jgi:glycine cleavage system H protein
VKKQKYGETAMVALFVIATILVCLAIDYFVQRAEKRKEALQPQVVLSTESFALPRGYFFSKAHTWLELLFSGKVYVGVDDFISKVTGKIDAIEVLPVGEKVKKGEPLLRLKQDSRTLTFLSPVNGKVVGVNPTVIESPEVILKDPYLNGWIVMIEPEDLASEVKDMLIGSEASQWLRNEVRRFREFISMEAPKFSPAVEPTLADGGLVIKGVLQNVDEKTWEKFEKEFIQKF